jgi:hypothetical protein
MLPALLPLAASPPAVFAIGCVVGVAWLTWLHKNVRAGGKDAAVLRRKKGALLLCTPGLWWVLLRAEPPGSSAGAFLHGLSAGGAARFIALSCSRSHWPLRCGRPLGRQTRNGCIALKGAFARVRAWLADIEARAVATKAVRGGGGGGAERCAQRPLTVQHSARA